jgi:hypothetical protein
MWFLRNAQNELEPEITRLRAEIKTLKQQKNRRRIEIMETILEIINSTKQQQQNDGGVVFAGLMAMRPRVDGLVYLPVEDIKDVPRPAPRPIRVIEAIPTVQDSLPEYAP